MLLGAHACYHKNTNYHENQQEERMKKNSITEKLQYRFDNIMAKGTVPLVGLLFAATALVVVVVAVLLALVDPTYTGVGSNVWISLMHIIDAGTITAADTADAAFVILMSIVTLCGLFVTSILIGIITTGFEEKLDALKKGNSRVIEQNHTVILGFNHNIYTIISELVLANENQKDACIVVLSPEEKELVEESIAQAVPDLKTTRIVCRTGAITDAYMLGKCALAGARSIIINSEEDFLTVKAILTINNYFTSAKIAQPPHIVATIREKANYDAIEIIEQGNVELLVVDDAISRIIAQTCRQPGLSNVMIELFDYDGDELYCETFPTFDGKPFGETLNAFEKAVVFGYQRGDDVFINPLADTTLQTGDALILLVEDDGMAKPAQNTWAPAAALRSEVTGTETPDQILVIGQNSMLGKIITQLDEYFCAGSHITLADNVPVPALDALQAQLQNITISFVECNTNDRAALELLTQTDISHVLLLSDDDRDAETADALTLLQLIHLRDIAQKKGKQFNITSEMQAVANQKLAQVTNANDLVVGSNIINLIVTQISENRALAKVFRELLQAEGSEIYIRPASNFVRLGTEMNFYQVTEIMQSHGQIAIGYKKQVGDSFEIIVNPTKSESLVFSEADAIIALAED